MSTITLYFSDNNHPSLVMMSYMRLKVGGTCIKAYFDNLTPTTSPQTQKIATNMGGSNLEVFKVFATIFLFVSLMRGGELANFFVAVWNV